MDPRGEIRVFAGSPETPRRSPPAAAPVLVVLVVGLLFGLGAFAASGASSAENTLPDPRDSGVRVVERFAAAWHQADLGAIDTLIGEDWESIALPGFTSPTFQAEDGRAGLSDRIEFLTSVATLSLGRCDSALAPPDSRATVVVTCTKASFEGAYLEAVWRNAWAELALQATVDSNSTPGIEFGLRGDRIISVAGDSIPFAPQAYCIWAEEAHPEIAPELFDLHCLPVTTADSATAHAVLAQAFLDAGAPLPSLALSRARLIAQYVDRFAELHNLGDTLTLRSWISYDVDASDLPGFPGSEADPDLSDYLLWSIRLIEIDPGDCTIELLDGVTIVTCPNLVVTSPLASEGLLQPTRFTLARPERGRAARNRARIMAIEPLGDRTGLPIVQTCLDLRASAPESAAAAFSEECQPIYTREGANALLEALAASPPSA